MNPESTTTADTTETGSKKTGRPLSRLATFSARQLEHINAWLDEGVSYREIAELCRTEFQKEVPHMTIARYYQRSAPRQVLDDRPESQEAAAQISHYAATGEARFSTTTLQLLEQQALDLALAFDRDADPADLHTLDQLHKIITRARNTAVRERHAQVQETKCDLRREDLALKRDLNEFKKQLALQKLDLARQTLELRRQESEYHRANSKPKTQNPDPEKKPDHLGPIATNWEEVGQRVCKLFGITPEEEARRAELHKTWKDPHARPGIPEEINPIDD